MTINPSVFRIFRIVEKKEFGLTIAEARKNRGLSIAIMERKSKLTRYHINQLEKGKTEFITQRDLEYICRLLIIDYMVALELTDCPTKLIEQLTKG